MCKVNRSVKTLTYIETKLTNQLNFYVGTDTDYSFIFLSKSKIKKKLKIFFSLFYSNPFSFRCEQTISIDFI